MNQDKIFLNIIRAGLLVALFVPLYVGKTLIFPFVVPKTMAFVIIIEALLIFYLPLAVASPRYRPKFSVMFWSVTVLYLVVLLTTITSINPYRSIWSTYERMGGFFVFAHYYLFFVILVGAFKKKEDWLFFMRGAVVVGILMGLYGIGQKFGVPNLVETGVNRVGGTIGNPIFLAAFLMFSIAFALILISDRQESDGWKYIYGLALVVETSAVIYTASRGVIIAMLGGVFLFSLLFIFFNPSGAKFKKYFIGIMVALVLFGIGLYAMRNSSLVDRPGILNRLSTVFRGGSEIQARLYAWNIGLQGWKERFWLGWGPENYNIVYNKYFDPKIMVSANSEVWFDRSHNIIFDWAVTSGIIGLVAYLIGTLLLPLYLLFRLILRRETGNFAYYAVPFIFLIAYFLQNFFVFEMVSSYMMFFLMLALITFLIDSVGQDEETKSEKKKLLRDFVQPSMGLTLLVAVVVIFWFFKVDVKILRAAYWTGQATQAGFISLNDPQKVSASTVMQTTQKSLAYNMFGDAEARMRLVNYVVKIADNIAFSQNPDASAIKNVTDYLNYAVSETQKSIARYPEDIRYVLDLGRLYVKLGMINRRQNADYFAKAKESFKKGVELSPRRQQVYFELANVAIMQNNFEEASKILSYVIELNPLVPEAHWNKALVLANMEKWTESALEVDKAIDLNLAEYKKTGTYLKFMVQIYTKVNNYARLVDVYSSLIELEKLDLLWYEGLATSYYNLGQKDKAVESAKKILDISPEYKAKVEELLKKLK